MLWLAYQAQKSRRGERVRLCVLASLGVFALLRESGFLVSRALLDMACALAAAALMWLALPPIAVGQVYAHTPEAIPLLREAAVVHRRVTMLARRVQRDLADSRRFHAGPRVACLNDVLSDLHRTQRNLEEWTTEVTRAEAITPRQRGMLRVFRLHLKELRAEALGCFGGGAATRAEVRVKITGPQPDEDPTRVSRPVVSDAPWAVPQR